MFRRLFVCLLAAVAICLPARAQIAAPQYEWRVIDADELTLWKDGVQVGNLVLTDGSYHPRVAPGRWGKPCMSPAVIPLEIRQRIQARRNWREHGVLTPEGTPLWVVPNSGLHIRKPDVKQGPANPKKVGDAQVPDYSKLPSITFVGRDLATAEKALGDFLQTPELAQYVAVYGPRAKAYQADDELIRAFKLDEDKQFQETGFVGLVQGPPDENDQAQVQSFYGPYEGPATLTRGLSGLRDPRPDYDPNASPSAPVVPAEWTPATAAVGSGLGMLALCGLGGAVVLRRRLAS